MVDAADHEKIEASRNELHNLLDKPQLQGIPILVLGNKRDLPGALDEKELIEKLYAIHLFIVWNTCTSYRFYFSTLEKIFLALCILEYLFVLKDLVIHKTKFIT